MKIKTELFALEDETSVPDSYGTFDAEKDQSLAELRVTLEGARVMEWPFQFWDDKERRRICPRLESLNSITETVYVIRIFDDDEEAPKRRRLDGLSFVIDSGVNPPVQLGQENVVVEVDDDQVLLELPASSRVSGSGDEETQLETLLKSKVVTDEVMEKYSRAEEKMRKELADVSLEDHSWAIKSFDQKGVGIVKKNCYECEKDFGGSSGDHSKNAIANLFSNWKKSHMSSHNHVRAWCRRKGLDWCNYPQSVQPKGKSVVLTVEDHQRLIREGVEIVKVVNEMAESNRVPFFIRGDTESEAQRCFWVKVHCIFCNDFFQLCPPKKNLEANLQNHLTGPRHAERVEAASASKSGGSALTTGKRGRPLRSSGASSYLGQKDLHRFFKNTTESSEAGEFQPWSRVEVMSLICCGFRAKSWMYGDKSYVVDGLLNDPHPGVNWFAEPHFSATVNTTSGCVIVNGVFCHRLCLRLSTSSEPWPALTCTMCATVPLENDFRMRVTREEVALEKRGSRSTEGGRCLGYLSFLELGVHSRVITKRYRLEQTRHWAAKRRVAQLQVSRPSLKEVAKQSSSDGNVLKFCHNILSAHRSGAFGGKPAIWDFMRDVAANLNRSKKGYIFSDNTKAFSQAMKMYGGRRMCDLFSLNYTGPLYSTTKRENRKGVQFIAGEHSSIFSLVAAIYREAKEVHGISGPTVPVILAEDETKVKSKVTWEQKWDSLAGFVAPKKATNVYQIINQLWDPVRQDITK